MNAGLNESIIACLETLLCLIQLFLNKFKWDWDEVSLDPRRLQGCKVKSKAKAGNIKPNKMDIQNHE